MYFCGWTIESHSPVYEIGPIFISHWSLDIPVLHHKIDNTWQPIGITFILKLCYNKNWDINCHKESYLPIFIVIYKQKYILILYFFVFKRDYQPPPRHLGQFRKSQTTRRETDAKTLWLVRKICCHNICCCPQTCEKITSNKNNIK